MAQQNDVLSRNLRLGLALKLLNAAGEQEIDLFYSWLLDQLEAEPALAQVSLAVDPSISHLMAGVSGPPEPFTGHALAHLADMEAADSEPARLRSALQRSRPRRVGNWLSVSQSGLDAGWLADVEAPFDVANGLADPTPELAAAGEWAGRHGPIKVKRIRRSIAEPSPMSELVLALPNVDAPEQMAIVQALHESLEITWFGPKIVAVLLADNSTEIEIVIAFTRRGVSRLGVLLSAPSRRLVLLLAGLSDERAHEKLAQFEGALGVKKPARLAFSRRAHHWNTELYYRLR